MIRTLKEKIQKHRANLLASDICQVVYTIIISVLYRTVSSNSNFECEK